MGMIQGIDGNALIQAARQGTQDGFDYRAKQTKLQQGEIQLERDRQYNSAGQDYLAAQGGVAGQGYASSNPQANVPSGGVAGQVPGAFNPAGATAGIPSAAPQVPAAAPQAPSAAPPAQSYDDSRARAHTAFMRMAYWNEEAANKMATAVKTMSEVELKQAEEQSVAQAAAASYLEKFPVEQRADQVQHIIPNLLAAGIPMAQIQQATSNLSDAALKGHQAIGETYHAMVVAQLDEHKAAVAPYTLSPGEHRFSGNTELASVAPEPKLQAFPESDNVYQVGGGGAINPAAHAYAAAFSGMGLPANAVAGLIGNLHVESGFNPGAVGDGGQASGVAQWHPDRAAKFQAMFGVDPGHATPVQAAQFLKTEIDALPAKQRSAILNASSPAAAAIAVDRFLERSSGDARAQRVAAAQQWADAGKPKLVHAGQKAAPSGWEWAKDGSLQPIKGGPADQVMDAPTRAVMVEQYLAGDKSVMTGLGRGNQGARNITLLRHDIAQEAAKRGWSGRDIAAATAEFQGIVAGERTLGNRTANIEMAGTEASKVIELARTASKAIPRSQFVPITKATQMLQRGTNNPALAKFIASNNAVVNTYARAISPSGVGTVEDKKHAYDMLSVAQNDEAYQAVLDQLQAEIGAARASPGDVRHSMRDAVGGGSSDHGSKVTVSNW